MHTDRWERRLGYGFGNFRELRGQWAPYDKVGPNDVHINLDSRYAKELAEVGMMVDVEGTLEGMPASIALVVDIDKGTHRQVIGYIENANLMLEDHTSGERGKGYDEPIVTHLDWIGYKRWGHLIDGDVDGNVSFELYFVQPPISEKEFLRRDSALEMNTGIETMLDKGSPEGSKSAKGILLEGA
ncbi:MAG: hypothetical protein KKH88_04265 [Nanoarchaeota archaeon]|nr:hypothetical protein [Nanoarchaeota archaeon]